MSKVKTFSGHSYPQSACGGASTNLQNLMTHSYVALIWSWNSYSLVNTSTEGLFPIRGSTKLTPLLFMEPAKDISSERPTQV